MKLIFGPAGDDDDGDIGNQNGDKNKNSAFYIFLDIISQF